MTISELAKKVGIPAKRIRYYESIDLMPPAQRAENGYRVYTTADLQRLLFIQRTRDLGFPLKDSKSLITLWQENGRSSRDVKALALRHIDDIEHRIQHLQTIKDTLTQLTRACAGDEQPDCPILDRFANE